LLQIQIRTCKFGAFLLSKMTEQPMHKKDASVKKRSLHVCTVLQALLSHIYLRKVIYNIQAAVQRVEIIVALLHIQISRADYCNVDSCQALHHGHAILNVKGISLTSYPTLFRSVYKLSVLDRICTAIYDVNC
jgi:hypothetical protein